MNESIIWKRRKPGPFGTMPDTWTSEAGTIYSYAHMGWWDRWEQRLLLANRSAAYSFVAIPSDKPFSNAVHPLQGTWYKTLRAAKCALTTRYKRRAWRNT